MAFGLPDRSVHQRLDDVETELEKLWEQVGGRPEDATPSQESDSAPERLTPVEAPAE